ncbi:MAG TPA: NAD(P)/FAD-dependent oxidoreductase [Anaerolineaceae bacterium]
MIQTDVLIVGGGPAGSACAWRLRQADINAIILDQVNFPRFKPCAGWITPEVLSALDFRIADYPYGLTTFTSFAVSIRGLNFKFPTRQHAIRRYEFDDWLLKRSGAPFYLHPVKAIVQVADGFEIDGDYCGKYLVGAGGTHCPVYRSLFRNDYPKAKRALIAAQEEEFPYSHTDEQCRLWFFYHGLPGYAWYVPKANGYVNVGVGGKADELNARGDSLKNHWNYLIEKLDQMGLVRDHTYKPSAHTYFLRQKNPQVQKGNAFLVGDSAGLATLEMGEGIYPAIKSGLLAAEAIIHGSPYSTSQIPKYSLISLLRAGLRINGGHS